MVSISEPSEAFFWINKHEGNLTSQNHRSAATSYLQKKRRPKIQRPQKSVASSIRTPFSWTRGENSDRDQNRHLQRGRPLDHLLPSPLSSPFTSQLDPFFPLPCKITHRDKSLVHYYLIEMQGPLYGMHCTEKGFCPIRDKTVINVQGNHTYLQWIVLTTEMFLLQGRPAAADEPHILSRKAFIYKLMNRAIADPTTCYSNNTLVAVAIAGCAEAYLGNYALGRKHHLALRLMIRRRGGSAILQDIVFSQAMLIVLSNVSCGVGEATFSDAAHLERATESFISVFQAMQSWNQRLRMDFEQYRDGNVSSLGIVTSANTLEPLSHSSHDMKSRDLHRYCLSRSKVFYKTSVLCKYLEPQNTSTVMRNKRYHFAVLWIINKLLFDLRADLHKSIKFLEDFLWNVTSSEMPGQGRGSTNAIEIHLTPLTIFCIVVACAAKHSPGSAERGGILHSWDAIDILELIELATEDSQEEVTAMLSSWLTNNECDIFYVGERRIEEVSQEIETEWLRRQIQHQR